MPFTGVIYIDASSEQGNLFIDNPLDTVLMTQPISPDVKYPMGQELEVSAGDLIMFPGFIKHRVKPNTTDKNRLVLGFNIGCRGNYWSSHWTSG
jgi:ectoine hydroxylase-related dioxygenase (phytanoyl-CoA dioxygenase family)